MRIDNADKKIIYSMVAGILSLIAIIGVSSAYFTASFNGSNSSGLISTALLGSVEYVTTVPSGTDVLPGWSGEGSTSIYFKTSSNVNVNYSCKVSLVNGSYSDNVYVQTISNNGDEVATTLTPLTVSGVIVASGVLETEEVTGSKGTEHSVTYKVLFKETGNAQNDDQERTINVHSTCEVDNNAYTTTGGNDTISGLMMDQDGHILPNQNFVAFSSPTYFSSDSQGRYTVTLPRGQHDIYFIPDMSMQDLQALGTSVKSDLSAEKETIFTVGTENIEFENFGSPKVTVSVTCNNCTSDEEEKVIYIGEDTSFEITANEHYTLDGATVTGGCTLVDGVLSINNVLESTTCIVTAPYPLLRTIILTDNQILESRTDFSSPFKENTDGKIYSNDWTDDGSTVYYYAGNNNSNWVRFADMLWRIIRTDTTSEGEGIRLIYFGSIYVGSLTLNNQEFNTCNSANCVGYMYSEESNTASNRHNNDTDSWIKKKVDSFYTSKLLDYDDKIEKKAIFCNDRSVNSSYSASGLIKYASYLRLYSNKKPKFRCGGNTGSGYYEVESNRLKDRFSASTSGGGNGALTYPVGLITADEVVFAGGYVQQENSSNPTLSDNWLKDFDYISLTMSPAYKYESTQSALANGTYKPKMYVVSKSGGLFQYTVSSYSTGLVYRPVISLKSTVRVSSGDGSSDHPYIIAD